MLTEDNYAQFVDKVTPQWLAGFFDGEGSVCASFDNQNRFKLSIELTQKNKYILILVMFKFAGSFRVQKSKNGNYHKLAWYNKDSIKILEYIKDYVIVKKQLVEHGLELAKTFEDKESFNLSQETKNLRHDLRSKILNINQANREKLVV